MTYYRVFSTIPWTSLKNGRSEFMQRQKMKSKAMKSHVHNVGIRIALVYLFIYYFRNPDNLFIYRFSYFAGGHEITGSAVLSR